MALKKLFLAIFIIFLSILFGCLSHGPYPTTVVNEMDVTAIREITYVYDLYLKRTTSVPKGYQVVDVISLPSNLVSSPDEAALSQEEKIHRMFMTELAKNPFAVLFREIENQGNFLLAIRGTIKAVEWIQDFRFSLVPFEPYYKSNAGPEDSIKVHKGFFTIYKAIRDVIFNRINAKKTQIVSLTISGHSLGSSIAVLLDYDMLLKKQTLNYTLNSIIFAAPRTGNKDFIDDLKKMLAQKDSFRIFNNSLDKVPHLPPQLLGYADYPNQMFFNFTYVGPSQGLIENAIFWHNAYNYGATLAHLYDKENPLPPNIKIDS